MLYVDKRYKTYNGATAKDNVAYNNGGNHQDYNCRQPKIYNPLSKVIYVVALLRIGTNILHNRSQFHTTETSSPQFRSFQLLELFQ